MELETLASGYGLIEGPRVDAEGGLYFSDVHNGGVYRRDLTIVTADNLQDPALGGTIFRGRSEHAGLAVPLARVCRSVATQTVLRTGIRSSPVAPQTPAEAPTLRMSHERWPAARFSSPASGGIG